MKSLLTFFTIIICTINSSYSQRICESGEYDFIFNIIKGVDKFPFSQIKLINKNNPTNKSSIYIYKYDNEGRLIYVDFKGNSSEYSENIDSGCNKTEKTYYKYSESKFPKEIKIIDDEDEYSSIVCYNKYNKIKKIKNKNIEISYSYDEKRQLKSIKKDGNIYNYYWNKNLLIKKIIITNPSSYTNREINFIYSKNKITKVSFVRRNKTNNIIVANHTYLYSYENERLYKVEKENSKGSIFYIYNYDHKDRLVITRETIDNTYINHYECYYQE